MKTKIILTTLLVCSFFICLAAITGLNGKWTGTVKISDVTELDLNYNFKVDGEKLTGTVETPDGSLPIANGVITGKDFAFTVKVDGMTVLQTGKYYGDSVIVSADVEGKTLRTTLKRVNK